MRQNTTVKAAVAVGLYAALHSLLATDKAQAAARRMFGPAAGRWYRLIYNALAIGLLVEQERRQAQLPSRTIFSLSPPWRSVMRLAQLGSFAGLAACLHLTDIATFLGIRQAGLLPPRHRRLVEHGPYGRVRHPGYWCMMGILWCKSSMTSTGLAENLVFTVYLGIASFFEERRLVREFGPAYLDYRRRVPRLFPISLPRGAKLRTPRVRAADGSQGRRNRPSREVHA